MASEPPPLPGQERSHLNDGLAHPQRLTGPWRVLLVLCCLGILALVVRLIYGHTIVRQNDAIRTDLVTLKTIEKRLDALKYRLCTARNIQDHSESHYLILAEIKTLPTRLSGYSRNRYEKMRVISVPLHEATLAYNEKVAAFFGPEGKWLAPLVTSPETLAEARSHIQSLAAENKNLRDLYKKRIVALAQEMEANGNNSTLEELLRLSEAKQSTYNLIRDSDAKIYETMEVLLQLMITEWGRWEHTQPPYLRWQTEDLTAQGNELFDELALLYQQQRNAQLELLGLTWNG
jgi:hypothetical protein